MCAGQKNMNRAYGLSVVESEIHSLDVNSVLVCTCGLDCCRCKPLVDNSIVD